MRKNTFRRMIACVLAVSLLGGNVQGIGLTQEGKALAAEEKESTGVDQQQTTQEQTTEEKSGEQKQETGTQVQEEPSTEKPEEPLVVSEDTVLEEDRKVSSLTIEKGTLNLNGHELEVDGDILLKGGTAEIGSGKLSCKGSMTKEDNARLSMDNINGALEIGGDFSWTDGYYSKSSSLSGGTLSIAGNIEIKAGTYVVFETGEGLEMVWNGTDTQKIEIDPRVNINQVTVENQSRGGIVSDKVLPIHHLKRNGHNITYGIEGESFGETLSSDKTVEGDYILAGGCLDLNGHKLVVKGDVYLLGGTIKIGTGSLETEGNFYQEWKKKEEQQDAAEIENGYGILDMEDENGTVLIKGNYEFQNEQKFENKLTVGEFRAEGNIDTRKKQYGADFVSEKDHAIILCGQKQQTVSMENSKRDGSRIDQLYFNNSSKEGVDCKEVYVQKVLNYESRTVNGVVKIGKDTEIKGGTAYSNLCLIEDKTLEQDLKIQGDLTIAGWPDLTIHQHKLEITGDCIVEEADSSGGLVMKQAEDYVLVHGNMNIKARSTEMSAGTLELKGNLNEINKSGFCATKEHILLLSGSEKQEIVAASGNTQFATLELKNTSAEGVAFNRIVKISTLHKNGVKVTYGNMESLSGWKLEKDESYDGDLLLTDGELDLNGHTLHVKGNMILSGGNLSVNKGKLSVDGDFRLQSVKEADETEDQKISYTNGNSWINMTQEEDQIVIGKDFVLQSFQTVQSRFQAGTITIKGNLYCKNLEDASENQYFSANGTHEFIFAGSSKQTIQTDKNTSLNIKNFTLQNQEGLLVEGEGSLYINGSVATGKNKIEGQLRLGGSVVFKDTELYGNVCLAGDLNIKEALTIHGDVTVTGAITVQAPLTIDGNLDLSERISMQKTELVVKGNCTQNYHRYTSGFEMTHEEDIVKIQGNYEITAGQSPNQTNGTLYIGGDFISKSTDSDGFVSKEAHTVVLNGTKKQTVSFAQSGSYIAHMKSENTSEEGIVSKGALPVLELTGKAKITYEAGEDEETEEQLQQGFTLTQDMELEQLCLAGGTLDLNGHQLKVKKDAKIYAGTIVFHGGTLLTEGDFTIASQGQEQCPVKLEMNEKEDRLEVGGKFLTYSRIEDKEQMTNGTIVLHGDFEQKGNRSSFVPTGEHIINFTGENAHSVVFQKKGGEDGCFCNVVISDKAGEVDLSDIYITGMIDDGKKQPKGIINAVKNFCAKDGVYRGDVCVPGELVMGSDLKIDGNLTVTNGCLKLNGHTLEVEKDCRVDNIYSNESGFVMENDTDLVKVHGDFNYKTSHQKKMEAGRISCEGNVSFENGSCFQPEGTHTFALTGTEKQSFEVAGTGVSFQTLEFDNASEQGIICNSGFQAKQVIRNTKNVLYNGENVETGLTLEQDSVVDGDYVLLGGVLDLNGHNLTVQGDFILAGGELYIHGGSLKVKKDFRIQNRVRKENTEDETEIEETYQYEKSQGILVMQEEKDYLLVEGSFYGDAKENNAEYLTNGTMEIQGDATGHLYCQEAKETGLTMVYSGEKQQNISFDESSRLAHVIWKNKEEGIRISKNLTVSGKITDETKAIEGDGCICIHDLDQLEGNEYHGSVRLSGNSALTKDLTICGNLYLNGQISLQQFRLKAESFTLERGTVNIETGMLVCENDMNMENDSILLMQNEKAAVKVKNKLSVGYGKETEEQLSAGTLEVQGDIEISKSGLFTPAKEHVTLLSGKKIRGGESYIQTISVGVETNRFGTLILDKNKEKDYYFKQDISKIALVTEERNKKVTPPSPVENVTITEVTDHEVTLSWPAVEEEDVAGYEIYRNGVSIGTTGNCSYTDVLAEAETEYIYAVAVYDHSGNEAKATESTKTVTKKDTTAPKKPVGLMVEGKTGSSVTICWEKEAGSESVAEYEIYRDGKYYDSVKGKTSYKDTSMEKDKLYAYTVAAKDASGNLSEQTEAVSTSVSMPKILKVTPAGDEKIYSDEAVISVVYKQYQKTAGSRVNVSYSEDEKEWHSITPYALEGQSKNPGEAEAVCRWNVTSLASGKNYQVRVEVKDEDGNSDTTELTYYIDHTPPKAPVKTEAEGNSGTVSLSWSTEDSVKTKGYIIYRRQKDETEYHQIAKTNAWHENTYQDRMVEYGVSYQYAVTAYDTQGRESQKAETQVVSVGMDTSAPSIVKADFGAEIINKTAKLNIQAKDNLKLAKAKAVIYEDKDGKKGDKTAELELAAKGESEETISLQWDTTDSVVRNGKYHVVCTAEDTAGNKSEEQEVTITVDNKGPEKTEITSTEVSGNVVTLKWEEPEEEQVRFVVEKQEGDNWTKAGEATGVLGYHVTGLETDSTYTFRVTPYDVLGNRGDSSEAVTVQTEADTTAPEITWAMPKEGKCQGIISVEAAARDNIACKDLKIEMSRDKDTWETLETLTVTDSTAEKKEENFTYRLDTADMEEGKLYLRYTASDATGNVSEPYEVCYEIDHTPPKQVENVCAQEKAGAVCLTWNLEKEAESYNLYRKDGEDGRYNLIAENWKEITYEDSDTEPGETYFYEITAKDEAGNESARSLSASAKTGEDTQKPKIESCLPQDGSRIGDSTEIKVLATDNCRVSQITIEARKKGEEVYTQLLCEEKEEQMGYVSYVWDTKDLEEGSYELRFCAKDRAGNTSDAKTVVYNRDKTLPEIAKLELTEENFKLHLKWNGQSNCTYEVYRRGTETEEWEKIKEQEETEYVDKTVQAGETYFYQIVTKDKETGNSIKSNIVSGQPQLIDTEAPQAVLADGYFAIAGMNVAFDGSMSTDNVGIVKYEWDMGTGDDVLHGKAPVYAYEETGVYNLTLTVWDAAGNSHSTTRSVIVRGSKECGRVRIRLEDAYGVPIAGAKVYQELENGNMVTTSDVDGMADINGVAGTQRIAIYKSGYQAVEKTVKIEPLKDKAETIVLEKGEIAKTYVHSHKMTYDELENAGVDLSNPDNYETYEFEMTIIYQKKKIPVETSGIIGSAESGDPIKLPAPAFSGETGDTAGTMYVQRTAVPSGEETKEDALFYVYVHGQTSWLKDFYQVDYGFTSMMSESLTMTVEREGVLEDDELEGLYGTGIHAKDTKEKIRAGETYATSTIVRCEKPGNYQVSAHIEGTIEEIEEPFALSMKNPDSITSENAEGLTFYVQAPDALFTNEPFQVYVDLVNESSKTFYGVTVNVESQSRFYKEFGPGEDADFILEFSGPEGEEDEYYKLIDHLLEVLRGENTGVRVVFQAIPVNIPTIRETLEDTDLDDLAGDPVNLKTGSYREEKELLSVTGGSELSFDLSYDSALSSYQGAAGYGWSNDFEVSMKTNKNSDITEVEWKPGIKSCYRSQDSGKTYYPTDASIKSKIEKKDSQYILTTENDKTYTFDESGRLCSVSTKEGKSVSIAYKDNIMELTEDISGKKLYISKNAAGKIQNVTDESGRKVSFTYENDCLTSIENPLGEKTEYVYDKDKQIQKVLQNGEVTVENTYDDSHRVITQDDGDKDTPLATYTYEKLDNSGRMSVTYQDRNGSKTTTEFSRKGNKTKQTDGNGHQTLWQYDINGDMVAETDGMGFTTFYEYDLNGYCVKSTDAYGKETGYRYDSNGNVLGITSAGKQTATYQYNKNNQMTASKDFAGKQATYEYNNQGQLVKETVKGKGTKEITYTKGQKTKETDYLGNSSTFRYDDMGNLVEFTDREGNTTSYGYDSLRRKIWEKDAAGKTETYKYDHNDNIIEKTDKAGNTIKYTYDKHQNLILTEGPGNKKESYTYDNEGRLISNTHSDGSKTEKTYDAVGNVLTETDENGHTKTYTYNAVNDKISETDELGNTQKYEYYKNGMLYRQYDKKGNKTLYSYNDDWQLMTIRHPDGSADTYEYDAGGNVITENDGEGNQIKRTYDCFGSCLSETDANGNTTRYEYDSNGNCIKKTQPDGQVYTMGYDREGRLLTVSTQVNGEEHTSKTEYDVLGRKVKETDEEGNIKQYTYTPYDEVQTVTDGEGNISENTYNEENRLIQTKDPLGNSIQYTYDKAGNLSGQTQTVQGKEQKYTYEYDKKGQMVKATNAEGNTGTNSYDALGNVTKTVNPEGGEIRYTYDENGNVLKEEEGTSEKTTEISTLTQTGTDNLSSPAQKATAVMQLADAGTASQTTAETETQTSTHYNKTYTYDNMGRIASATNSRGQTITYKYDKAGRVTEETAPEGKTSYTYDANGNILTVTDKNGTITNTYDSMNRLKSSTDYKGNTVKYSYDEIGNLIALTYPGGEIVRYTYYKNGNLKTVSDSKNHVTTYQYDKANRLTSCSRPDGTVETYQYDKAGHLTEKTDKKEEQVLSHVTYTYDEAGNIISQTGDGGDVPKIENVQMTYDVNNRLLTYQGEAIKYDADGNMTYGPLDGKMTEMHYDSKNRLIQAGDTKYAYDYEGNRISKTEQGKTESYVIAKVEGQSQIIEVMDERQESVGNQETELYVYGNGMISKEVISHDRKQENTQKPASGETTEETTTDYQLYHHNHIGNTMYLTDITGKKTSEYTYGPYGELTGAKDLKNDRTTEGTDGNSLLDGIKERFLFQGKYGVETEANGLYYMRTRYYNADIKRFISRDIVTGSIADSNSLNRYTYVEGNPISKTDPFGLSPDIQYTEMGHHVLDVLGFIPGYGDAVDLVNAAMYYMEGNVSAGNVSLLCAIPVFGSAVGQGYKVAKAGTKVGKNVAKAARAVGNSAEVETKVLTKLSKAGNALQQGIGGLLVGAAKLTTHLISKTGNAIKKGISEFKKAGTKLKAKATEIRQKWKNQRNGGSKSGSNTALTVYDPEFAARQMLVGGETSEDLLRSIVPKGTPNTFVPTATIKDGYKYNFSINGKKVEIKWHSQDLNAAIKYPGSNSGAGWTAQIKVGNKLLTQSGRFVKKPQNYTHIPLKGGD